MTKKTDPFLYSKEIKAAYEDGVLLLSRKDDHANAMTIGWGMMGVLWGKPMFLAFVRNSRDTKEYLDANPNFTVSIPLGKTPKEALLYCGTHHGKGRDKIKEAGLTLVPGITNGIGAIKELPLTLECHVLYSQEMKKEDFPEEVRKRYYLEKVGSEATDSSRETHTCYFGEIVDSYLLED